MTKVVNHQFIRLDILDLEIEAALQVAAAQVHHGAVVSSCYMVSDALVRVLHRLGYEDARCVSADVYGWNADADKMMADPSIIRDMERMRSGAGRRQGFKKRSRILKLEPYTINLHHEQVVDGDGYDGHVMVEVAGHILCATFGQFNRPDGGILVHNFALIPLDRFVKMPKSHRGYNPNITKKSERGRKLAMTGSRERGFIVIALRYDIKDGVWLDQQPETRENIAAYADDLFVDVQGLIQHCRDNDLK